jgi:hypothetical protein
MANGNIPGQRILLYLVRLHLSTLGLVSGGRGYCGEARIMSDKLTLPLWEPVQAHKAILAVYARAKPLLMAGHRLVVELRPEKRSDAENRLLHAMLGYISKNMEWAGKKRDVDTWKRLLIAAWCRATNEQVEILPALDGHGIDLVYKKSSTLSRAECADLITFIYAWGSENDVHFPPSPSEIETYER